MGKKELEPVVLEENEMLNKENDTYTLNDFVKKFSIKQILNLITVVCALAVVLVTTVLFMNTPEEILKEITYNGVKATIFLTGVFVILKKAYLFVDSQFYKK